MIEVGFDHFSHTTSSNQKQSVLHSTQYKVHSWINLNNIITRYITRYTIEITYYTKHINDIKIIITNKPKMKKIQSQLFVSTESGSQSSSFVSKTFNENESIDSFDDPYRRDFKDDVLFASLHPSYTKFQVP